MSYVRTNYRQVYAPRPIPRALIKSLVDALGTFKTGLPTTSRIIKARAISHGKITDLQGPDCWKVIDPHPLAELEQVHVELLLAQEKENSCELHIEFRNEHIFLSVSDIQTGWGKSVHEDMQHLLATYDISSKGFKERLRSVYSFLCILKNVLLAVAVAVYATWLSGHSFAYLYASIGLFIAGAMPAATQVARFFFPVKKFALLHETLPKGLGFPLAEASAIIAFIGGAIQLGKELVSLLW